MTHKKYFTKNGFQQFMKFPVIIKIYSLAILNEVDQNQNLAI
jgi:hypothetical protein